MGSPATLVYENAVFSRISLVYYLFLLKNDWFKFVKSSLADKVHKLFFLRSKLLLARWHKSN